MKRELLAALACVALSAIFATADAHAQGGPPRPKPAASGASSASAGPLDAGAVMPKGHPMVPPTDDPDGEDDPRGGGDPHGGGGGDPHAGGGGGGMQAGGMGEAPEDGALDDPTIAKGAVEVHIMDPTGKPLPHTDVTLGIIYNSVAKGESRKRVLAKTDDVGTARFANLDVGSGVAYRPMVLKDGATFSVTPFQLGLKSGIRALLHVYPVSSDIEQTLVVGQSMLYAEVKDDRIQIQQAFKIYNFGKNAWVPQDVIVKLPENFTAFATQQGMTDVGVDAVPNQGVKIRGTFTPGQHVVEFKWQLPYTGESEVKFDVGMPPHLAAARVIAPAGKGMALDVAGFPAPQTSTDGQGQRALVTERQLKREDAPVKSIAVTIKGLPTEGPGKVIATFLALGGLVAGIVLGVRKTPPRDTKREREQLLAALESLELSYREGTIGPKTYERGRRELLDDIARTFAADPRAAKPAKPGRKKVAS